jgi:pyridoxamine 5'-phosphate oxidase
MLYNIVGFLVINLSAKQSLAFVRQFRLPYVTRLSSTSVNPAKTGTLNEQTQTTSNSESIALFRKEYSQKGLDETDSTVSSGPIALFQQWLNDAIKSKTLEPNAMCLSTCVNNVPSARYVLLKEFNERGFVWYTNYNSRKSSELNHNPHAAITFWWGELERQVRIEGIVEKVSAEESNEYFNVRPRGSQIGAWSSNQSSTIESREALENQELNMIKKFEQESTIPRPPHWGGWRLIPKRIEFWKGRQSRLHDRLVFERESYDPHAKWTMKRLQP